MIVDNIQIGYDLQPSTLAFGWVGQAFVRRKIPALKGSLLLHARYDANFISASDYRYGDKGRLSLTGMRTFNRFLGASLTFRGEYTGPDHRFDFTPSLVKHTGSVVCYSALQLILLLKQKWYFTVSPEIPVYRDYTGIQMSNRIAVMLGVTRDFSVRAVSH